MKTKLNSQWVDVSALGLILYVYIQNMIKNCIKWIKMSKLTLIIISLALGSKYDNKVIKIKLDY